MERTLTSQTPQKIGKTVKVSGWVARRRDHGKLVFIDLRDRSGILQIVGDQNLGDLKNEYVVEIQGTVKKRPEKMVNPNLETGTVELEAEKVEILSKAQSLPFDMGEDTLNLELPTLLDWRALTLRHPKQKAIFKVQEVVIDAFREGLKKKDFTEFQSPVIIPQGAEGGSQVFEVKYFDHKAFLAQSPQFYKQILVGVYERVFTVNKTLRSEPSVTTRHLTEVTTLDAEFGFISGWEELMDVAEYLIKYIFDRVGNECREYLKMFSASVPKVGKSIPRIKLRDAQKIIFERTGRDSRKEPDLSPEDEKDICRWSSEEKDSELVFVTHYPTSKRPFYTFPDPQDPEHTLSFDLIGRGVEWMTGGRRITDLKHLEKNARERGVDLKKSEIYLQAFKFGMPPEGGFSFGSERITQHILGLGNIREASLFPRDMERVDVRLSTPESS